MIPVQETAGPIPNINYRAEKLVGSQGIYEHRQRIRLVHHRVALGEVRLPLPPEHRGLPDQLLQQLAAELRVHERRPQRGDGERRRERDAGTAPVHVRAVRAGSLDGRASVAAGRAALRAPRRLLPAAADGTEQLPANAIVFPAQDGPLNQKDLMPRFGASYDVFGNGKTAVKFFLGRYVTTFNTVDEWASYSPAGLGHFVSSDYNEAGPTRTTTSSPTATS